MEVRQQLEAHRDELRARIAELAKRPELGAAQGFGKRIGDGTVEAISRLTEIGVGTTLETSLERTERALAKLDEGTYGLCDACGEPIAPKRLAVMPDVVLCVECAREQAPRLRRRR
jgi:DnaK suppressor protein